MTLPNQKHFLNKPSSKSDKPEPYRPYETIRCYCRFFQVGRHCLLEAEFFFGMLDPCSLS